MLLFNLRVKFVVYVVLYAYTTLHCVLSLFIQLVTFTLYMLVTCDTTIYLYLSHYTPSFARYTAPLPLPSHCILFQPFTLHLVPVRFATFCASPSPYTLYLPVTLRVGCALHTGPVYNTLHPIPTRDPNTPASTTVYSIGYYLYSSIMVAYSNLKTLHPLITSTSGKLILTRRHLSRHGESLLKAAQV